MIVIGARVVNLATGSFCGSDNFHGTLASLRGKVPHPTLPSSSPYLILRADNRVDANYKTRE